jgi:PTH1 family peptidyl-tRNA hydrolase
VVADHAELLAKADDPGFQNKVHLAMAGRGWDEVKTLGARN